MAFKLKGDFTFTGTCPRHKRYDPIKYGQGAIKGGCPKCAAIYRVWAAWISFMEQRNTADEILK